MCDESEFLSNYGIRSLSKYHQMNPYILHLDRQSYNISYVPGESDSFIFGGNSNWRGPIWMPMNVLLAESLHRVDNFYKTELLIEYPSRSGRKIRPQAVSFDIYERLISLFLPDHNGNRPCHGDDQIFNNDPYWQNLIYFYEYFHGDNGRGLGASHQTGWTATVSNLVYAVASAREYYKSILSPQGKEFVEIHSKSFNKNYWNPMNLKECFEVKEYLLKSSFKTLMDMMEALFNHSNWKYQNLLVHHAVSVYGK